MTTRPLTCRLAYLTAPLIGSLLMTACSQEPPSPAQIASVEAEASQGELRACPEPKLESLHGGRSRAMPVAYPASELERPLLMARPFPLADPQFPPPPVALPRSIAREVRSLPDEPLAVAPELSPPTVVELPVDQPVASRLPASPQPLPGVAPATQTASPPPVGQVEPSYNEPSTAHSTPATFAAQRASAAPIRAGQLSGKYPQAAAMQAVNRQAEQMIRRGYHLAERGALYSGRAEFIQALRTIAQAIDIQSGARQHTQALAAGLTALEEAEDFIPDGSGLESDLDVAALVHAHQTPVCKDMDAEQLMPVVVLQHYYTYAQQQLAVAAGGEEAASMALFGLGKTYATLAIEKSMSSAIAEPKAMVFHWAALAADGGNFLAANELAVLEARWGQYTTARALLRYSVAILPHSAVWRNLALVHQRLGETKLAELAQREAQVAAKREATARPGNPEGIVPSSDVEWLDSKSFAATSRSEIDPQKPAPASEKPGIKATPVVAPAPPRQRSAAAWFPWFR